MVIKGLMKIFGGSSDNSNEAASGSDSSRGPEKKQDIAKSLKDLENFVDYIVRALVDFPEEVRVSSEGKDSDSSIIVIDCKKEDIGKIVGKRGKTIMAIRSLVSGAAGRLRKKVSVEVND